MVIVQIQMGVQSVMTIIIWISNSPKKESRKDPPMVLYINDPLCASKGEFFFLERFEVETEGLEKWDFSFFWGFENYLRKLRGKICWEVGSKFWAENFGSKKRELLGRIQSFSEDVFRWWWSWRQFVVLFCCPEGGKILDALFLFSSFCLIFAFEVVKIYFSYSFRELAAETLQGCRFFLRWLNQIHVKICVLLIVLLFRFICLGSTVSYCWCWITIILFW